MAGDPHLAQVLDQLQGQDLPQEHATNFPNDQTEIHSDDCSGTSGAH